MWPESLRWLDRQQANLAENLAEDVAILNAVEQTPSLATLRCWESASYGVVVGRTNRIDREVDVTACEADGVPIIRRESGGGTVVVGPGCLCFSLVLPIPEELPRLGISGVTQAVMQRLAEALAHNSDKIVSVRGISDLVVENRKICGNAQRWKRRAFLHHGTILYDFDLAKIERYLRLPARQPDYRAGRAHHDFVVNWGDSRQEIIERLQQAWNAK